MKRASGRVLTTRAFLTNAVTMIFLPELWLPLFTLMSHRLRSSEHLPLLETSLI